LATSTRFFGRYEHALDLKGRVILPAKLRIHFSQPGFLTRHLEGCLALWTNEEFDKEINLRLVEAENDPVARNRVRDWAAAVFEAEIDRQGRIAIPPSLRGYAGLEQEVLVIGMINRIELWSPASWANRDLGDAATQLDRPWTSPIEGQVTE
jgi:MraZ protein